MALRKKISSLQGDGFDPKMTVNDYKRLISIQKVRLAERGVFLPALDVDPLCCLHANAAWRSEERGGSARERGALV